MGLSWELTKPVKWVGRLETDSGVDKPRLKSFKSFKIRRWLMMITYEYQDFRRYLTIPNMSNRFMTLFMWSWLRGYIKQFKQFSVSGGETEWTSWDAMGFIWHFLAFLYLCLGFMSGIYMAVFSQSHPCRRWNFHEDSICDHQSSLGEPSPFPSCQKDQHSHDYHGYPAW